MDIRLRWMAWCLVLTLEGVDGEGDEDGQQGRKGGRVAVAVWMYAVYVLSGGC